MSAPLILHPVSSGDVHHGERYFTVEGHVVEGYSATEQVSPGVKFAGNHMLGPAVTVYVENTDGIDWRSIAQELATQLRWFDHTDDWATGDAEAITRYDEAVAKENAK